MFIIYSITFIYTFHITLIFKPKINSNIYIT